MSESDSSSDESSSEEVQQQPAKPTPAKEESDSSSDDSSDDEEAPAKTVTPAAKDDDSSSDDSSSDEEEEEKKPAPAPTPAKDDDDSSSDDSSSDDEEEPPKKTTAPAAAADDDSSSDDSSDEEEEEKKPEPAVAKPAAKEDSSDSDSSSDEEEEEKTAPAKTEAAADDSSDDSSSEDEEEEKAPAKTAEAADDDSSDDSSDDEEEKPAAKAPEKEEPVEEPEKIETFTPVMSSGPVKILCEWNIAESLGSMKETVSISRKRKLSDASSPASKKKQVTEKSAAKSGSVSVEITKEYNPDDFKSNHLKDQTNTIFVKGIDKNAYEADIEAFFTEQVCKPVSIRHKWDEERPGLAWITFATNEQASKAVIDCNNEYIKDRYVNTDWAEERKNSGKKSFGSGPKNANLKGTTNRIWIGNLHRECENETLIDLFKPTATPTDVFILGRDESRPKMAYCSFETTDLASAVVETYQGSSVMDHNIRLDWAEPRRDGGNGGRKRKQELSEKQEGCVTCFVGRLSDTVDDDKLVELFKDCGEVTNIRYMERDGEFKGVAFVQFSETEATDKAVQLNGTSFLGKNIRVDFAADRKKREF